MLALFLLMACTSDDTGDTASGQPLLLKSPPEGTTYRYAVHATGGDSLHWPGSFAEGWYKGTDYTEVVLGDFSVVHPKGVRAYVDLGDGTSADVAIRAVQVWGGEEEYPNLEYVFDPAAVLQLDGHLLNETLTVEPTGEFLVNGETHALDLQIAYTLTGTNDAIDVPYNRVQGCWTWNIVVTEQGFDKETRLSVKSKLGLVRVDWLPGNFTEIELEDVITP
ncbi:MAG: hypothetical protein JXB39_02990 [Deltaproteobacteria bacterium]|nr:hypothetical protein [Deltaproteobacteria bacterium]